MQRFRDRWYTHTVHLIVLTSVMLGVVLMLVEPFFNTRTSSIVHVGIAAAAGECEAAGLVSVGSTGLCTHGSDPSLAGGDGSAVSEAEASTRPSLAICTGNGTSGRRVQVIYARQAGLPSRYSEFLTSFRVWSAETSQIYSDSAVRSGGQRYIRFVHDAGCAIDVKNVTLPNAYSSDFGTVVSELASLGLSNAKRKYLVFLDVGSYVDCGLSTLLPDDSPGSGNLNNVATGYSLIYPRCWSDTHILVHELGHAFGAVQDSAPHATGGSHCYDEWDVMCYDDGNGIGLISSCKDQADQGLLDCKNDDYFNTNPKPGSYLATHWNIAKSGWLGTTGAPPATDLPANDAIENAKVIDSLPFLDESNTLRATTAPSDSVGSGEACWGDLAKSVWYRFKVPAGGSYTFQTIGSGYNTVMAAFTGSPGRLRRLACNDNLSDSDRASRILASNVSPGTTIYLMIGAFPSQVGATPPASGGFLRVSATWSGQITLGRSFGRFASSIPITLSGFPANTDVALTFDGSPLMAGDSQVTVRTNSSGGVRGTFYVPGANAGAHTVGAVIGGIVFSVPFEVTPHVRLSPNRGGAGMLISVRLYGFQAGEKVAVRWRRLDGRLQTLRITSATGKQASSIVTGANGSVTGTIAVPVYAIPGTFAIQADGLSSGLRATVEFTVAGVSATATPTKTPPPSATSTATLSPTATSTVAPSETETPTETPSITPTASPTIALTDIPTQEPSPTASATDIPAPSSTPTEGNPDG